MKEIFLLPTTASEFKEIDLNHIVEIPTGITFREAGYILFYDREKGIAESIARIESVRYPRPVDPLVTVAAIRIKISIPVSIGRKLQINLENPPAQLEFDRLFTCLATDTPLSAGVPPNPREAELLANSYLEQAMSYMGKQKAPEALMMLEHILDLTRDAFLVHFYVANIHLDSGKLDLAIYHYNHCLTLNPRFEHAWNFLGLAYLQRNDVDSALAIWTKSLDINPDSEFARMNRGKAWMQLKRYEEAREDLEKAIELDEKNWFARNLLGVACANLEELDKAVSIWNSIIEAGEDDEFLHLNLARALSEKGELRKSLQEYQMLLEAFPEEHELHGVVQRTIQDLHERIRQEDKGKEFNLPAGDSEKIAYLKKTFQISLQLQGEGHRLNWDRLLQYLSDFGYMNLNIQILILDMNEATDYHFTRDTGTLTIGKKGCRDTRGLRAALRKAADEIPEREVDNGIRVKTISLGEEQLVDEGQLDEAISQAREAINQDPKNEWIRYSLGSLLSQKGNFSDAVEQFAEAAKINPNHSISLYAMGLSHVRLEQFEDAARALQRAIIAKPDERLQAVYDEWNFKDSLPYFALGDVLIRMNRFADAVSVFRKGLMTDATSSLAHFQLGTCHEVLGELEAARDSLTNAISLDPEFSYAFSKLGIVYFKMERPVEAMSMLQKAVSFDNADSESFFFLGEAAEKLGKPHEARAAWNMTMQVSEPDDVYHRRAQERLLGGKAQKPEKPARKRRPRKKK